MFKQKLNQTGFAHAGLAVFAVFTVMAIGLVGYNVTQNQASKDVLGASTNKKSVKINKKGRTMPGGTVQFVVKEQVTDSKGKKTLVARGNVPVELTATAKNQACRDAGKLYVRDGNIVFAGKTDADKDHKNNVGKIKADRCLVGKYKATLKLSDKYVFVSAKSKDISIKKGSTKKVTFTIAKKSTTADDGNKQSTDVVPTPAPAPSATAPITAAEEVKAIDTTNKFEDDMFFNLSKKCDTPTEDLGEKLATRKASFAKNATSYMTPALIAKVNGSMAGDAFGLLGVSDYKCAQYSFIDIKLSKPLVTNGSTNTAVVEHSFTGKARDLPTDGYPKAADFTKTWSYNLVKDGDYWKISSVDVK